jgi:hypothetical protein
MPWSLVEALAIPGQRRPFCVPLASGAPDFSEVGPDQYDPEDDRTTNPNDPRLRVVISPPQGGQFADQGSLPDPAIRLYAMGAAWVRFKPAHAAYKDSLELRLATFAAFPLRKSSGGPAFPRWWGRWVEARCIPDRVIYENVDAALVRATLESVNAPVDNQFENRVLPTLGLQFPYSVTQATRADFIDHFMAGEDDYFMVAEAGAYLGAAAPANPASPGQNVDRLLTLHAQYDDHAQTSPHPMNPLELFNLLFGNDSVESLLHPLLLRIDAKGKFQSGHESKSMRRRPPLRTHARVMWEADLETVDPNLVAATPEATTNAPQWAALGDVLGRLYNDFSGTDETGAARHFYRAAYNTCTDAHGNLTGCWKCNLFVFDVALRAGFRVITHAPGASTWHYRDPNQVVRRLNEVLPNPGPQQPEKVPVTNKLQNALKTEPLAWNIEGLLRSRNSSQIRQEINRQINEEGRCFAVVCSRVKGSGHMVLVESVANDGTSYKLTLAPSGARGFSVLPVRLRAATTPGARKGFSVFSVSPSNFSSVHLFELHPGKDPDTPRGLQDCNGAVYS